MSDLVVLTFAELEFLLRSRPPAIASTRESLDLPAGADSDVVAAAGLASLLAAGRCHARDGEIVPTDETVSIIAGLATADRLVRTVGWVGDQTIVAHFFDGPNHRIVLRRAQFGQYSVQAIDTDRPLSTFLIEFVMSCLGSDGPRAVLVQVTTSTDSAGMAVAANDGGTLVMSDSIESADRGMPTDHQRIAARLVNLVDRFPVAASR
jgi:hypothetical protein